MPNLLQRIFKPNWILIDTFYGDSYSYKIGTRYEHATGNARQHNSQNIFKILYSDIRKKYKLSYDGCHNVTKDSAYHKALNKLAEYNKSLIK